MCLIICAGYCRMLGIARSIVCIVSVFQGDWGLRSSWAVCHWLMRICLSGVKKGGGGFLYQACQGSNNNEVQKISFP